MITQLLKVFVRKRFFNDLGSLYLMYTPDGTFYNIVLIFEPGKKRRHDSANIVQCDFAGITSVLIIGQIEAKIVRLNVAYVLMNGISHIHKCVRVLLRSLFCS